MISDYTQKVKISVICSVVSSSAILISMAQVDGLVEWVIKILASLLFWVGLIMEQVFIWKANKQRGLIEKSLSGYKCRGLPGICSFFKTEMGFITDVTFIFSMIVYIVFAVGNGGVKVMQYVFLFLIVLSFRLHCIANGKNYRYKLYLQKRRAKS